MFRKTSIAYLYNYCKEVGANLFPTNNSLDFWAGYAANASKFDLYFFQKYRAFSVDVNFTERTRDEFKLKAFQDLFETHLFINSKRYSELYKVQVLASDAYDVVNNYDLHETSTRKNTGYQDTQYGQRVDSQQYGQKQNTYLYGAKDETTVHGAREDINDTTLGEQTSGSTQTRSAFNSSGMVNVSGGSIENGAREDSSTLNVGEQTDTYKTLQHTDIDTEAQHTDQLTKGQQTDRRTDDLSEDVVLHRYGNIGVQTPADVIGGHLKLWEEYNFYKMIFEEFATLYLLLDLDGDAFGIVMYDDGGIDVDEIMGAISDLSEQLTTATGSIRGDVDGVNTAVGNVNTAVGNVNTAVGGIDTKVNNIDIKVGAVASQLTASTLVIRNDISALSSQVTASSFAIRGDISEVMTNGY